MTKDARAKAIADIPWFLRRRKPLCPNCEVLLNQLEEAQATIERLATALESPE